MEKTTKILLGLGIGAAAYYFFFYKKPQGSVAKPTETTGASVPPKTGDAHEIPSAPALVPEPTPFGNPMGGLGSAQGSTGFTNDVTISVSDLAASNIVSPTFQPKPVNVASL